MSDCEWVQFVNGEYWARFEFVELKEDPASDGKILCLTRVGWEFQLFEKKGNFYKTKSGFKKIESIVSNEMTGWKYPAKKCHTHKKSIFQNKYFISIKNFE